jgi:hypothetical protein
VLFPPPGVEPGLHINPGEAMANIR